MSLPPGELSAIVEARKKLARHGKTIEDAAALTSITWSESAGATSLSPSWPKKWLKRSARMA